MLFGWCVKLPSHGVKGQEGCKGDENQPFCYGWFYFPLCLKPQSARLKGIQSTFFFDNKAITTLFNDHSLRSMLEIKMNKDLSSFLLFPSHASLNDLKHFYQTIQEGDREDEVSDYLRQFDADITRFKIFSDQVI